MNNRADDVAAAYSLFQTMDGGSTPTSALDLIVREINHETAFKIYEKFHYLGKTEFLSTLNYGTFFDGFCVGAISFGSPNAKNLFPFFDENTQEGWFEIKRLAMADKCPKNSESRFIAIAIKLIRKKFDIIGIVTYADSGVGHVGTIYKASGFQYVGLTAIKSDFQSNGKIIQRGKVVGLEGNWIPRSQKHLFVKKF